MTATLGAIPPIKLCWTPKVGDKAVYKVAMVRESDGREVDGTLVEETVSLDAERIVTTVSGTISAGDRETPAAEETVTTSPSGTVLGVREGNEGPKGEPFRRARLGALMLPGAPVAVGEKWSVTAHEDDRPDVPDLTIDYTLVGEERIGEWKTYRIAAKGGEAGGRAKVEATFWVEKTTGARVRTRTRITTPGEGLQRATIVDSDIVRQS